MLTEVLFQLTFMFQKSNFPHFLNGREKKKEKEREGVWVWGINFISLTSKLV